MKRSGILGYSNLAFHITGADVTFGLDPIDIIGLYFV